MLSYLSNRRMWKQLEILTLGPGGYLEDCVLGHYVETSIFYKVWCTGSPDAACLKKFCKKSAQHSTAQHSTHTGVKSVECWTSYPVLEDENGDGKSAISCVLCRVDFWNKDFLKELSWLQVVYPYTYRRLLRSILTWSQKFPQYRLSAPYLLDIERHVP